MLSGGEAAAEGAAQGGDIFDLGELRKQVAELQRQLALAGKLAIYTINIHLFITWVRCYLLGNLLLS